MSDKHSLAEDKPHSLSEMPQSLDKDVKTVGIYPNEDRGQQKAEDEVEDDETEEGEEEDGESGEGINSWRGWHWVLIFWSVAIFIVSLNHFVLHWF